MSCYAFSELLEWFHGKNAEKTPFKLFIRPRQDQEKFYFNIYHDHQVNIATSHIRIDSKTRYQSRLKKDTLRKAAIIERGSCDRR